MWFLFGVVLLFNGVMFLLFGVIFFCSLATCSFCSQKWHLHCSCKETTANASKFQRVERSIDDCSFGVLWRNSVKNC